MIFDAVHSEFIEKLMRHEPSHEQQWLFVQFCELHAIEPKVL